MFPGKKTVKYGKREKKLKGKKAAQSLSCYKHPTKGHGWTTDNARWARTFEDQFCANHIQRTITSLSRADEKLWFDTSRSKYHTLLQWYYPNTSPRQPNRVHMTHDTKSQLNGNKTHHQSTVVEFRSTSCEQWMDHSRHTHPWKSTSAGRCWGMQGLILRSRHCTSSLVVPQP